MDTLREIAQLDRTQVSHRLSATRARQLAETARGDRIRAEDVLAACIRKERQTARQARELEKRAREDALERGQMLREPLE